MRRPGSRPGLRPSDIDRLAVWRYNARLVALEPFEAAEERLANIIRGVFDICFRSLVCHDMALRCAECPVRPECAYVQALSPAWPEGRAASDTAKGDAPRPFAFRMPSLGRDAFAVGAALEVGFALFGKGHLHLPLFIAAIRDIGERRGLGSPRGRLRLASVVSEGANGAPRSAVYGPGQDLVAPPAPVRIGDVVRPEDASASRVRIDFVSPTSIKRDGVLLRRPPALGELMWRMRERLSALCLLYGEGETAIDARAISRIADAARTVHCETAWAGRVRESTRTGDRHEISGFLGTATYEGALGPLMPLLRMAELVHVGKYAPWGNGRVRVTVEA